MECDHEGFWYPKVDTTRCNSCGICERVCPVIEGNDISIERLPYPQALAAWNTDHAIRLDSTSGGVFSALASRMLELGGIVAGAVYVEDHTVSHIVTSDYRTLDELRSSKYLQSYIGDLFNNIKTLLEDDKQVLICGTPCQIDGLYHVLGKDYKGLVTCDFICRGVNSPKIFVKYIEMLEQKYDSRAIHIKFKDKTHGWHRFSTRIEFANGTTYIKDRYHDLFMRGYLEYNYFVRPSCYSCKYKKIPRIADITLADFWGLNTIYPEWDNDCGTSAILLNSEKGRTFFQGLGDALSVHECALEDIAIGNLTLSQSVAKKPGREQFFADLDAMPFYKLLEKHISEPGRIKKAIKRILAKAKGILRIFQGGWRYMGFHPSAWMQFIFVNLIRKNTHADVRRHRMLIPTRFCCIILDASARITFNGLFILGWKRIRKSRLETRFMVGKNAQVIVNGSFQAYVGTDIWVFDNGKLTIDNGFCNEGVQITCAKSITLGNGCAIARDVIIRDYDAHQLLGTDHKTAKEIRVGDHVWIGTRAVILKGVTIGDGSIIAAGAVVTKDVPPHSLAAGVPAKVIRENVTWQ